MVFLYMFVILLVGGSGKVIGIDLTDEMLRKARNNAKQGAYTNVEFRKG
jgi:arsenite methyltransferase